MPRHSTRHPGRTVPIDIRFSLGANQAEPNHSISDQESPRLHNFIYRINTDVPIVRPAIRVALALAQKLGGPIVALHYYVVNASTAYVVCAANNKLYYLSTTDTWTEIGDITADVEPTMITFNGKLLVADNADAGLRSWDGTTYGYVTGSPGNPTIVIEHNNRVVCNSLASGYLDAVCFSKVEDETGWTYTSVGGAVLVRAGYKDGLEVRGLASGPYDDVVVSKRSITGTTSRARKTYRIQTSDDAYSGTSQQWAVEPLFPTTGAKNEKCLISADDTIYYLSDEGFSRLESTAAYGDLVNRRVGARITSVLEEKVIPRYYGLVYVPEWGTIAIFQKDNAEAYLYHPWLKDRNEETTGGWTSIGLGSIRWSALCQADNVIYLGGSDGMLYKIGNETQPEDALVFSTHVCTINAAAKTITADSGSPFSLHGFKRGGKVSIYGSGAGNDGTYTIAALSNTVITVSEALTTNETSIALYFNSPIDTEWLTKNFDFGHEGLVKRAEIYYEPITDGSIILSYRCNESATIRTAGTETITTTGTSQDLYDATDDLGGLSTDIAAYPDQDLVQLAEKGRKFISRVKVRLPNITFRGIGTGRFILSRVRADIAVLGEA